MVGVVPGFLMEYVQGTEQSIETLFEHTTMIIKQQLLSKQSNTFGAFEDNVYDYE